MHAFRRALRLLVCLGAAACATAPEGAPPGASGPPDAPEKTSKDAAFSPKPTVQRLTLLHTSDSESDLLGSEGDGQGGRAWGGLARATTLVSALRERSGETPAVLLAAGDTMMPAPELKIDLDGENAVSRANNLLGYKASALGNHEFDLGEAFLADFIKAAGFPYLTATLSFEGGPLDELDVEDSELTADNTWLIHHPGRILPRGKLCVDGELKKAPTGKWLCSGLVLGVVGATTETLRTISSISDQVQVVKGLDGIKRAVQQQVDALTAEGVDHIVLLSHLQDVNRELELVDLGLTGVDVIVAGGGDDRLADQADRLLPNQQPDPVCAGEELSCYPILRRARDGAPVAIVATDGQLRYIGHLTVLFDEEGVLTGYDTLGSRPWPVDEQSLVELRAEPSREALSFENRLRETLTPLLTPFAHSDVFLDGTREGVRNHETNLANLSTDAMLWAARSALGDDVAFALRNGGGIRAPIGNVDRETHERQGSPLRPLDVQSALRFDNPIVVVETTHQVVKDTLESGLRGAGTSRGHFPHVSGNVTLTYHLAAPEQTHVVEQGHVVALGCPGARVRDLTLVDAAGNERVIVADGEVREPERKIKVATLKYLSRGGDAYFPVVARQLSPLVAEAAGDPHTEQSTLRDFVLDLEERGAWRRGASYPPIDGDKPETHRRVRRIAAPLPDDAEVPEGCTTSSVAQGR